METVVDHQRRHLTPAVHSSWLWRLPAEHRLPVDPDFWDTDDTDLDVLLDLAADRLDSKVVA